MTDETQKETAPADEKKAEPKKKFPNSTEEVPEIGGRDGPEPTRYGDWEKGGHCIDF